MIATFVPSGRAWELLYLLTRRDLKLRYQDTALGFLWSMAKPLALGAVLYVAMQKIVRIQVEDYHLVLLSGLFPWVWFQSSVFLATGSFAGNGALIKKVRFPKFVLPFSVILNNGVHFLLAILILLLFLLVDGKAPTAIWLVGVPFLIAIQLGLLLGTVLFLASIDVYFRDLEHLIEVFLTLLFYSTPILYPLSRVPEDWRWVALINPLASLIEGWRDVFLRNQFPGLDIWPALVASLGVLLLGWAAFRRLEPGFVDVL